MPCASEDEGPWFDPERFPSVEESLTGWIQVGFTENMEMQVKETLQGEFKNVFVDKGLGIKHIHVERHEFHAQHFRV
jgi:hypothetical protein